MGFPLGISHCAEPNPFQATFTNFQRHPEMPANTFVIHFIGCDHLPKTNIYLPFEDGYSS